MKTYKVLYIDAWADFQTCPHCGSSEVMEQVSKPGMKCNSCLEVFDENEGVTWAWNNWHKVDEYKEEENGELNEENALNFFFDQYITITREEFLSRYELDDDQFNLVIVERNSRKPLFAIEYGSEV